MYFHFRAGASRRGLLSGLLLAAAASLFAQSPPSGVWTTAATGSINIAWNTVPGANYNVYRGTAAGAEGAMPIVTTGSTNYTDSAITAGKTYYYKVTAIYGSHQSAKSVEVTGIAGASLAGASSVVAFAGNNKVLLQYSAVPSATFYRIFRINSYLGWQLVGTTTALQFTDAAVSNGVSYTYNVTAGDTGTDGNASSTVSSVPGDAPLGSPAVTVTTASTGANNVGWSPVPGAIGYVVYRGKTSHGEGTQPYALVGGNGFTDSPLTNGTTYYYTIAAIDYSGTSAVGPETSGTPGSTQLNGGLIVATAGATSIGLNWQPTAGATSYYIVRGDGNYYNNQVLLAKVTGTTYTDTAVAVGGSYYYTAFPANVDGEGNDNNQASATVGDNVLPPPTGLNITSQKSALQLNWNPVTGAYGYAIYRASHGAVSLYAIAYETTNFTDNSVSTGALYTYSVSSLNADSESTLSLQVTAEVNETPLPGTVATATVSGTNITIYWRLEDLAASYDVFRSVVGGSYYVVASGVKPGIGATAGTFTDSTAPAGVDCVYYVCGVNAFGLGNPSNTVSAGAGDPIPPAPVGSFAYSSTTSMGANAINVSVNPVPGINSYNVYRGTKSGQEGDVPIATSVGNNYQDPNVVTGKTYYYTFTSVDDDGQSAFSPECRCTWGAKALPAPILTTYPGATAITLDWSAVPGATAYDVFRAIGNGSYVLYQQNVSGTTLVDTDVSSAQWVSYQVYPMNSLGVGNRSNTVTARAGTVPPATTTGIFAVSTGTGAMVSWNAVPGNNMSYNIYRSLVSGEEGFVPIVVGIQGNGIVNFTDATTVAGRVYYYTITAVTPDNQSEQSAEVSVKSESSQLVAPTLSASSASGSVSLTWNPIPGAANYNLFREDPIMGWMLYQQNVSGTTYIDTSVISGVGYAYYVAAVSVNGQGIISNNAYGNP